MYMSVALILGGIGLLLYGIEIMKDSLEWLTQNPGQKILAMSGRSTAKAVLAGFVLTVINQKSTATTMLVVSMVNVGMLSLVQAAGVILGANIGTTVTAQILAFQFEWEAILLIGLSAIFWRVARSRRNEMIGKAVLGLGMMFAGIYFMRQGMEPLQDLGFVRYYLDIYANPSGTAYLVAVLIGFVITAFVGSSSLVSGILLAMAMEGLMPITMAVPVILGVNVGKCIATIWSSRGTSRTARQAAVLHLFFNTLGALVIILFFRNMFTEAMIWLAPGSTVRQIANSHTLFNLGASLISIPLIHPFVKLTERIVPETQEDVREKSKLDVRMLDTPGLAIAQSYSELIRLTRMAIGSFELSMQSLSSDSEKIWDRLQEREEKLLQLEKEIEIYLVRLSKKEITREHRRSLNLLLSMMGHVEQISDTCNNIVLLFNYKRETKVVFTADGTASIRDYAERIKSLGICAAQAMDENNGEMLDALVQEERELERLSEQYSEGHIARLSEGRCSPGAGALYVDILSDMERISEHIRKACQFAVELEEI